MINVLREWWRDRKIARAPFTPAHWQAAWALVPAARRLDPDTRARLRDLAILFLDDKRVEGVHGLVVDEVVRLVIALHACLLVLNLGLRWYRGWRSIVVYPDEFLATGEHVDDAGVVHVVRRPLTGESWHNGPVILAWSEIADPPGDPGYNVVIHEFAHKLDMLDGAANGCPPLHSGMDRAQWARVMQEAFDDLAARDERREPLPVDPYATESPDEFFAVVSELFFGDPGQLESAYPPVYRQLAAFYRQDPLAVA